MGEVRAIKYNLVNKKTTASIPPDDVFLVLHSARANYWTTIIKRFAEPDAPESPFNHEWFTGNDGTIPAKKYSTKPALPINFTDIINQMEGVTHEQEEDSD